MNFVLLLKCGFLACKYVYIDFFILLLFFCVVVLVCYVLIIFVVFTLYF